MGFETAGTVRSGRHDVGIPLGWRRDLRVTKRPSWPPVETQAARGGEVAVVVVVAVVMVVVVVVEGRGART